MAPPAGGATVVLVGTLALAPATASATWSIVAVDPETQEVGVAVASCVEAPLGTTILPQVAGLAPGVGALAAQALYSQANRDEALMLLTEGTAPQDVIDMVVAGDPQAATRQYGVVTLDLQVAAFTGAATQDWAGDVQGVGVSAQGNILHGPEVVDDALAAFEAKPPRCPWTLADRLMLALEAGAAQGGDERCSEAQSALAAALRVARPGDAAERPTIDLRIASQPPGGDNPVALLRAEYDAWRAMNPPDASGCDMGPGSSSGGADDTAGETASSTGATASSGEPDDGPSTGPAPPDPPAPTSTTATDGTAGAGDADGSGCGCRARGAATAWAWWIMLGAAYVARGMRRRRRAPTAAVLTR